MKNKITSFLLLLLCLALNVSDAIAQQKHEYVDLGLPSGTLWATTNVGAKNPWDYGDYFAWGETTTKAKYDLSTYKYANGADGNTKYCNNPKYGYNGFTDNKTDLERSDDAATANWGSDWCMPTRDQLQELIDKCTWTWTTDHGIDGYKVAGTNGKSIFLPAAGFRHGTGLFVGAGSIGYYWSSSLDTGGPDYGRRLYCRAGCVYPDWGDRRYGQSVRPVRCRN